MTEQDERLIYEWAGFREPHKHQHVWAYVTDRDGGYSFNKFCPELDMNFAFDMCIPKLNSASVSVTFTNFDDAGRWHLIDAKCGDAVETVDYEHTDFYSALLAYIKGVK